MSKTFTVEIFKGVINAGTSYYSSPEFYDLLGRPDTLTLQAIVDATPGADTVTAQYQTSNEGSQDGVWHDVGTFKAQPAPSGTTDVPKAAIGRNASSDAMGAFGRVKVTCTTQNGIAVRVLASGRTQG